jgi:effector-binding domain-containing protein
MFKIGDFSKLGRVTVRALRHYEEVGLLKPIQVDRFTGYRYYTIDQLPRLNRILVLKDLGFSLEQIAPMLDEDLPPAELRGMLRLKQAEIRQQVDAEQARLARVEARLRQIEQEGKMPTYEVIVKKVEPQRVASVREMIPTPQDIGRLFEKLFTYLGQRGVQPLGAPGAIWHDMEHPEKEWDAEVIVPIGQALPDGNGVKAIQLPGVATMASTVHQGSYEGFPQAYAALMSWIESNGYRMAGPMRETYLRGPGPDQPDPATYVTEIQVPVEKA